MVEGQTGYLALGSNQGNRLEHLQAAVTGLDRDTRVSVQAVSSVYETEAHTDDPDEEQPAFLNAVVEVEVGCSPIDLLELAQSLEWEEGRDRSRNERWAPRPLDVDLLVVGGITCHGERLTLPHPRLADRAFVLRPWTDLAPNLHVPPPFDASVRALLDACPDTHAIRRTVHDLTVPSRDDGEHRDEQV